MFFAIRNGTFMTTLDETLSVFRAIGEETRLRILALLCRGELTVSECTQILGQSQPRVSRHLKILTDAGLTERHREGAWMFYRIAAHAREHDAFGSILDAVAALNDNADRIIERDFDRFEQSRQARADIAAQYFRENAEQWQELRNLHLPEADIEQQIIKLVGEGPFDLFVDLGTGTGRMLELFADRYKAGIGYDVSQEMLAIARTNLDAARLSHAQARFGDLFSIPGESGTADIVCIHHVLHFLAEPEAAVREAARLLKPGGQLVISDFAPHELEFLREEHAHRRLGFSDQEVSQWCRKAGLTLEEIETLSPGAANNKRLTVKIWLCSAPNTVKRLARVV